MSEMSGEDPAVSLESGKFNGADPWTWIFGLTLFLTLFWISSYNYLLFHTLAELFSIGVAWGVFLLVWNSRRLARNDALVLLGIAYLFVGLLDLVHTLSYKGMGVLDESWGADPATQLWIAARSLESLSLLAFPLLLGRNVPPKVLLGAYGGVTALVLAAVFAWRVFPPCFVEGSGLTPFKIVSEYVIVLVLVAALTLLYRKRHALDSGVYRLMTLSVSLTIFAELAFTFYVSVYGLSNLAGHYLKILSFFLVYVALIRSGLTKPYAVLFRELHQRERELGENRRKLYRALKIARLGSWEWDLETGAIHWPSDLPAVCDVEKSKASSVEAFRGLVDQRDLPFFDGFMEAVRTGRAPEPVEYRARTSGGGVCWIRSSVEFFQDDAGHPKKAVVTVQDVTEGKKAEEELVKTKKRLEKVFQSQHDAIFLLGAAIPATIEDCNAAACRMFGYPRDEMIGRDTAFLHTSESALKEFQEILYPAIQREGFLKLHEFSMRRKDGTVFPTEHTVLPLENEESGRAGWVSFLRDITPQKQAEHDLKRQIDFAQKLIDAIPVSVFYKGVHGKYLGCNNAYAEFLGLSKDEIIGKGVRDVFPPDLADKYFEKDKELFAKPGVQQYEAQIIHSDGTRHDVLFNKATYCDERGRIIGLIGAMLDVSDRKRSEREKESLEAQLRQTQKMEALGALAGGIAHDFNNILSPILGYAEMLEYDLPEDSPQQRKLKEILIAGRRAADLVRQILTFSRQTRIEKKPFQVHLIVKEVIKLIRSTLPTTIRIEQDIDSRCPMVLADPTEIHQIAMNLVTNAFHAMEDEGGTLAIRLGECPWPSDAEAGSHGPPPRCIRLEISDTGVGMDPQLLDRIFDPYFTTKDKEKGTGLGLAVVHGIVKSYGGHISVRSTPGEGTSFQVYLPGHESEQESGKGTVPLELPKGTERILLVDDEEQILKLLQQMLEKLGYRAEIRTHSPEALETFTNNPHGYDLVITDMTMPQLTGDRLALELMKVRPDLPVIICTGFSEKLSPQWAQASGIKGILMKPVVISELACMVREALDGEATAES